MTLFRGRNLLVMTALLGVLFLGCRPLLVAAAPDLIAQQEIDYLLSRLEKSDCRFYRNGDWYDAARARQHLERKYAWLVKRDLVANAEQFIERAATNSSRSGEPYLVQCAENPAMPSAEWLTEELIVYRERKLPQ